MIKFFRNIRRKLLGQKRFSRYLLYAIGEIILVVFGILIALQINNWNEVQKINKRQAETIQQLHEEAGEIITEIKADIEMMDEYIEASKKAAYKLQSENSTISDTSFFAKGIIGVTFYPGLSVPRNVYDEINSAGQLREIRSSEIRAAISRYYADLTWFESQLEYFRDVNLSRESIFILNSMNLPT